MHEQMFAKELDDVLVPLRQREKEIRQLRLEVDELQRKKERDSSRQVHGAVRARSDQQRRMDELSCRQRIEELQAQAEAARRAEEDLRSARRAEARELQHAAQRSARVLRETEEDLARAEVRAGSLKHVVAQVFSDAAQYSIGNEELRARESELRDQVLRCEARCNYLRSKVEGSSPSSPRRRWWGCGNQAAAEAAEVLRAEHLSQEVEDLQKQLPPGSQWRMVTSVMQQTGVIKQQLMTRTSVVRVDHSGFVSRYNDADGSRITFLCVTYKTLQISSPKLNP
eukprot:s3557_g6.t1